MPVYTQHQPGTFCWADLLTNEQEAAKKFYSELLGWEAEDRTVAPGVYYSMMRKNGQYVCAVAPMPPHLRDSGAPQHWSSYVSVSDVAASAQRVQELGGTLLAEPFAVFTAGQMAIFKDPTGAILSLWQPGDHSGAGLKGEPGSLCWAELMTRDIQGAKDFYAGLFGWTAATAPPDADGIAYTTFSLDGEPVAGMLEILPQWGDAPPSWLVYLCVADCEAGTARAKELGSNVLVPPTPIPGVGPFSLHLDPQGAVFYLLELAEMPSKAGEGQ